jgi:septum formation protein
LVGAGIRFEVRPAEVDEASVKRDARAEGLGAEDAALRLADLKAATVARTLPDRVVIGADQILVCEGVWYDKPTDVAGAREQLCRLRGRRHVLATATVCYLGQGRIWRHVATPALTMRDFSAEFLEAYLEAEGDALTSTVGAYRVEGSGVHLFEAFVGEHSAILGLPLLPLLSFLRQFGVFAI